MLNKLLKSSLILVLAISLTACAGGKKKKPGKDIGDDNVSAESDLGKLLEIE